MVQILGSDDTWYKISYAVKALSRLKVNFEKVDSIRKEHHIIPVVINMLRLSRLITGEDFYL